MGTTAMASGYLPRRRREHRALARHRRHFPRTAYPDVSSTPAGLGRCHGLRCSCHLIPCAAVAGEQAPLPPTSPAAVWCQVLHGAVAGPKVAQLPELPE